MTFVERVAVAASNWIDGLPIDARSALHGAMQARPFPRGALIYNRTDRPDGLYLIRSGSALFQIDGINGKRFLLKIIRENELFGEIAAYDGKPAPIAVEARSAIVTDFIPIGHMEQLRSQFASIDQALAAVATQNLRATLTAIEELTLLDLRERAIACLKRLSTELGHPDDACARIDVTQTEFASMLGASRQATNKVLSEFESAGWLKRHFRHLIWMPSRIR